MADIPDNLLDDVFSGGGGGGGAGGAIPAIPHSGGTSGGGGGGGGGAMTGAGPSAAAGPSGVVMFDIVRFLAAAAALNANPGLAFDTVWASTPSPTQLPEAKQALQRLSSQGGHSAAGALTTAAVSRAMATASPALQQHFLQCVRQLADQIGDISSVVDLYTLAQTTVQRAATPALQAYATAAGTRGTPNDVSTLLQRSKLRSGGGSANGTCSATASTSGGSCGAITAVAVIAILAAVALAIAVGLGWSRLKKAQAQLQGQGQGQGQGQAFAAARGGRHHQGQAQGQLCTADSWGGYGNYGGRGGDYRVGGGGGGDPMTQFPQQPAFAPLLPSSSMDMPDGFGM